MTSKSAISQLEEVCARTNKYPKPIYVDVPSPSIASAPFAVKVSGFEVSFVGVGTTKKAAKNNAATQLFNYVKDNKLIFGLESLPITTNDVDLNSLTSIMSSATISTISTSPAKAVVRPLNAISHLLELCVKLKLPLATFVEVERFGADNLPTFTIECQINEHRQRGSGHSKKSAKHRAALNMLNFLNVNVPQIAYPDVVQNTPQCKEMPTYDTYTTDAQLMENYRQQREQLDCGKLTKEVFFKSMSDETRQKCIELIEHDNFNPIDKFHMLLVDLDLSSNVKRVEHSEHKDMVRLEIIEFDIGNDVCGQGKQFYNNMLSYFHTAISSSNTDWAYVPRKA